VKWALPGRGSIPAGVALALVAALAGSAARAQPAPERSPLLRSAEQSTATVVGTLEEPRRLDAHGYAAVLVVERVLHGETAPETRQQIAWEEFSPNRPPRFAAGERILVALEPLPSSSLWKSRIPGGAALAVAAQGRAAWKAPDAATIESLGGYLRLDATARGSAAGASALIGIAADAAPAIAESALEALATRAGLEAQLDGDGGARARERFAELLADPERPLALREAAVALVGVRRLSPLRPAVAAHTEAGDPLEAAAWEALVRIDGVLPPERVQVLLARDEPALRVVALRYGGAAVDDDRLVAAANDDPAGAVRVAAIEALLARRGVAALDSAVPLLFDADAAVGRETALRISRLGANAVPALRATFEERPYEEISELAPVALALAASGPDGTAALEQIAADHPDEARRKLADLALGRMGEVH
jgi:hypothetical protein